MKDVIVIQHFGMNATELYIYEHFSELKRQIDIHREELKINKNPNNEETAECYRMSEQKTKTIPKKQVWLLSSKDLK